MKINSRFLVGPMLILAIATCIAAQEKSASMGSTPPRLLVIQREFIKPGKAGTVHEKSETAFVQAMARAKWPTHYIALQSLSGKPRALFFLSYDSYESWEKDTQAQEKNATLSTALDRANEADGALLDSSDQGVFTYNADLSLHPVGDLSHMRYLEIWAVSIKPGHWKEWMEINKIYRTAAEKAVPTLHWAVYEGAYGTPNGTYLFFTARKSAAELDRGPMEEKAIQEALGEENMKKLDEMFAATVSSSESQIFSFSPSMSYAPDELIKGDPDFWKPKQAAVTPAKAEKKPAGQP
jgi:hypothetical protein